MFNIRFTQTSIDHALQIMERLVQLPCAKPFLLPVDPVRDGVPNYYHVITQPIDISLINEKLLLIKYSFIHEWVRDMFQIRDNAKTFNGANSYIYLLARRLIERFEKELKEFYVYNTKLWTKRYQEIAKKLQEQMKQIPPVLSGQGQSSSRIDHLMSQNMSTLILNENQPRKPIPIQNNSNLNSNSLKAPSFNSRIESTNEVIKPVSIQQISELSQPAPQPSADNIDSFERHENEFAFSKKDPQITPIFQPPPPQPKPSIFSLGNPQNSRSGSIFGDIDLQSLPPTLPMADSPSTSKSNPFLNSQSKNLTVDPPMPKPAANLSSNPAFTFPTSSSMPHQFPQPVQQIFPQQQFQHQPQQQLNDQRYRTNFYGMVNGLISDPSTISPPEIGPIVNSKPNFNPEGESISPMSYIPESTMATSLTSSSVMNNTEVNPSFANSIKFFNGSKGPDQINEQKKLFILHYIALFNNFSDMLTMNKIISIREPQFSTSNNEIDLALLHPSTINELVNFMGQRLNSSKLGNNPTINNSANSNLDS